MEGNIDTLKSFELERLLNKRLVKRRKGRKVEYLVCWKEYGPKWDRWYNAKDFDNTIDFVQDYNTSLQTAAGAYFSNTVVVFFSL